MKDLSTFGIKLSSRRVGDHKALCPLCSDTRKNSTDPCLAVTIEDTGGAVWVCHHCGWSGGYGGKGGDSPPPIKQHKKPVLPDEDALTLDHAHLIFLYDRLISNETIDYFGLYSATRWIGGKEVRCIAYPYWQNGEVFNVKYRSLSKDFAQEKDAKKTLYGIDAILENWETSKTLVIVEGEMDVLAMREAGINAITLPDGASRSAKKDDSSKRFAVFKDYEWMVEAEKVVIATDNDTAGIALRSEIEHRFGKDRCWLVDWPPPHKDANEYLIACGCAKLAEQVAMATPSPIDGLYKPTDYVEQFMALWQGKYARPISTGFDKLDEIYTVMPSTFCLVTGIPNHGKSNFVDQLAVNMMNLHEWKFAIFSPEHSTANHLRRLSEKVVRKPFDSFGGDRMTATEALEAVYKMDNHFYFIEAHENVPDIDWILSKVKVACLRYGINGVIIDPYNEVSMNLHAGAREVDHIRDLIRKCKRFCQHFGVAMWFVAHPVKQHKDENGRYVAPSLYDVSGSADWYNMPDVGLTVYRDFETGEVEIITRKIREHGLYGKIGKRLFSYNQRTCTYVSLEV